ncbi:beta-1,4-xylosyltransferase IRX9 [Magnolia sinica]|uniref:beta-1,4-xylosyltransferase IRX9 n=1 Tax=Magnolia sinica TaxID=86752 RepID=UPI002658D65D|nr:beta-1,4-xylosyltransferase IRX9 [Magnolia sinica]
MGSSKKKIQLWKKALLHFSLCFCMGFFTGFAPRNTASILSNPSGMSNQTWLDNNLTFSPQPSESVHYDSNSNRGLAEIPSQSPTYSKEEKKEEEEKESKETPKLLIIVTPISTRSNPWFQVPFLRRLGNTLKLVPPPLLWIVVQSHYNSSESTEVLRKTGIMYRHLIYRDNFTNQEAEMDHQRNLAFNHIEHHRLHGIVHFAPISNIYPLHFFQAIREIEVIGTWPMAMLAANRKRVVMEGPICSSSQVMGWHLRNERNKTNPTFAIHISSFAFNTSILWDPERWGRSSSTPDHSQKAMEFVQQVVVEDETKLKGITDDCSNIMLWHLRIGHSSSPPKSPPKVADGPLQK